MAINKSITTTYGIDTNHTIINRIDINRDISGVDILIYRYPSSDNYNSGSTPLVIDTLVFKFSELPQTTMTKITDLKDQIEQDMVTYLQQFSGGTIVNDDGTST